MAITAGLTYQAKQDFLKGVHATGDVYKLAFYSSTSTLAPATCTVYTATNEVTNTTVIPAGGVTLTGYTAGINGTSGYLDWGDINVTVTGTFTANGALLYNSSKSNAAIALFAFGADKTATDGAFQVTIPTSGTGLITFT